MSEGMSEAKSATDDEWTRPRPGTEVYRVDAPIAAVLALGSLTVALLYERTGFYEEVAEPWAWALGIGLSSLPLAFRRRHPVPVAVVVAVGFYLCQQLSVPDLLIVQICLFLALYSVGAWERNRRLALWSRIGIVAAMFVWIFVNLLILSSGEDLAEMFPNVVRASIFSAFATFAAIQIITNLLYFAGAFLFGERAWQSARTTARLEAQGRELERERRTSAARAVALDRLEIARELHDVVAHHVSVMGIQAAAARRTMERDPQQAAQSLEIVEESAHTAVTELRGLVHTLRSPASEEASSTLGVVQIPELVEECVRAGTPASFIVVGESRPLPLLVDIALYRVVQEALTNVRKHAGTGAEAVVRLRFIRDAVEAEVADDGVRRTAGTSPAPLLPPDEGLGAAGPAAGEIGGNAADGAGARAAVEHGVDRLRGAGGDGMPGGGLGLRGMKERVGAVGGSVTAGRREQGGFLVRARVPLGRREEGIRVHGVRDQEAIV